MFGFLREKISVQSMASAMYVAAILDAVQKDIKDADGIVIISLEEQKLALLSHLCELLDAHSLQDVKLQLLFIFAKEERNAEGKSALVVETSLLMVVTKNIQEFFTALPSNSYEFVGKQWVFERELNPMQKILILPWYGENVKAMDAFFNAVVRKYKVINSD